MPRLPRHTLQFAAAVALVLGCVPALARNLVANGDFARGGEPPSGWVIEPEAKRKGSLRVAGGVLELAPNGRNTPSDKPLGIGQAIDASRLAGTTLAVSASLGLRAPATGAVVGLHALRENGSEIDKVHLRRTSPGEALETVTGTLVIPAGEAPKLLILFAVAEGTGGSATFADIRVAPAEARAGERPAANAPTAGTATAAPAGGASYAARVRVDAGKRGRAIPRDLYGVNIEWWRNANGLWDEGGDRVDDRALALSRDVGVTLIRFPGGFLGDAYDWRAGVGPRRERKAVVAQPSSGEKGRPLFGTDEVAQFAGAIGSGLMLQVNLGTGSPALAADWVRHMTQRHGAGPRVGWWELGNELYHKGDASGVSLTPEAYADKFLATARAMRAVAPELRLGAIAMENYATFPFNSHPDWNEKVLRRAGAEIDFLAVHNAYFPIGPDDRADPKGVYRALLASPRLVEENLRTVAGQIDRHAPGARAGRIAIAVTEWAPLFHVNPASAWIDHSKTLGSALFVADVLRVFVQNERVGAATFFKLNEPSFLGLFAQRKGEWTPNASYHAFQLYTRHFGATLVESLREAPGFDSPRAGIVPALRGTPLLESVASVSADGQRLYVMLINKSLDQGADVRLEVEGFSPASGTAHLLSGASPDANTGTELPRIPGLRWGRQVNVDARQRHFDRGDPSQVRLASSPLAGAGRAFSYRLPPHSAASLELVRAR